MTPSPALPGDGGTDLDVLRATLRVNTTILAVLLGLVTSIALGVLAIAASHGDWGGPLVVGLLGVFLPGYGRSVGGVLLGMLWGFAMGACFGALIYRLNTVHVLASIDELVITDGPGEEFPAAVLRLDGRYLGLAIGTAGALGLFITTNLLVLRGTADESVHARLLGEVLPGYAVSLPGSIIGAAELFVVLYLLCTLFVAVYNGVAGARRRRAMRTPTH